MKKLIMQKLTICVCVVPYVRGFTCVHKSPHLFTLRCIRLHIHSQHVFTNILEAPDRDRPKVDRTVPAPKPPHLFTHMRWKLTKEFHRSGEAKDKNAQFLTSKAA
jgi:hypothetical protein